MAEKKEGISLKRLIGGILQGLKEAKHLGDVESARLHEIYKKEKSLAPFSVPAFGLSDIEVELKFAVVELEDKKGKTNTSELTVNISPEFLKGLEVHQVSTMKLKIAPVNLRVFEEGEPAQDQARRV